MNKVLSSILILLILSVSKFYSQNYFEKSDKSKKTILDYYLLLPQEFFLCNQNNSDSPENRMSCIKLADVSNGYIMAEPSEGYKICIALFPNNTTNRDIIAISGTCIKNCDCIVKNFLEYDNGQWVNSKTLPEKEMNEFENLLAEMKGKEINTELVIPRKGNSIKVVDVETKKILYELKWNGNLFAMTNITKLPKTTEEDSSDE